MTAAASEPTEFKLPPHDLDAEKATLAGCLLDVDTLETVVSIVEPEQFYHPSHGVIFESILAVKARNQPVDLITVAQELKQRERLNTIGGAQYLGQLTDLLPSVAHVGSYAKTVRDLAGVRNTMAAAEEILKRGYEVTNPSEFQGTAAARILETTDVKTEHEPVRLCELLNAAYEQIEKTAQSETRLTGLPTGIKDFDLLTAGLHPGQLIVEAARPGVGKTSLALQQALHVAVETNRPVLFFSLEMPARELTNRLLCSQARVDHNRLRSNMLTADDMVALTKASADVYAAPLYVDDFADASLLYIRAKARAMLKHNLALVVIDYLQLMKPPRSGMESREREVAETSRGLKVLAKEMNIPVIALSQLNRSPETRPGKNHRPQLADLRESGSVEQDADVVLFIYRDEMYNKDSDDRGIAELIIAKQRNGPTDTVRTRFIRQLTRFENLAEDEASYAQPPYDPGPDEDPSI